MSDAEKRIWGDSGYRVFLSHKAEEKLRAAELKEKLNTFGFSCFVAHEDIHPTEEWQGEIECALKSMDAFIALMTEKFHKSSWTDQEVGFAFGRDVPIIAVRMGADPRGFIGKFQALSCDKNDLPRNIVQILIKYDSAKNAYIDAIRNCSCYDHANKLAEIFRYIDDLSDKQIDNLISAHNNNSQVYDAHGFTGDKPRHYGNGIISFLNNISDDRFVFKQSRKEISKSKKVKPPKKRQST